MNKYAFISLLFLAVMLFGATGSSAAVPGPMHFQGVLTDNEGALLDGQYTITVSLYESQDSATPVWGQTSVVQVVGGAVDIVLGEAGQLISQELLSSPELWLGVQVESDPELLPRQQVLSVPYATRAAYADSAANVPDAQQVAEWAGQAGYALLSDLADGSADTAPVAWAGLTGLPAGFADGVDDGLTLGQVMDVLLGYYTKAEMDALLTSYALAGHGHVWEELAGVPAGFADGVDDDTQYGASEAGGLVLADGLFSLTTECADGQVLLWNQAESAWECATIEHPAEVGDIEGVVAGPGLSGGATSGTAELSVNPAAVQMRISGACLDGGILGVAEDGTVACDFDNDLLAGITCWDGQSLKWSAATGGWQCGQDLVGDGDITAVQAGAGLLGGGNEGSVALAVDPATTQVRVTGTCTNGGISAIDASGAVTCDADNDALGGLTCAAGQIAKWSGTAWTCAPDRGIVSITRTQGAIDSLVANSAFAFIGPSNSINIAAGQGVLVFSTLGVGVAVTAGTGLYLSTCAQAGGTGVIMEQMDYLQDLSFGANQRLPVGLANYFTGLPTGTYRFGPCYKTTSSAFTNNDWAVVVVVVVQL